MELLQKFKSLNLGQRNWVKLYAKNQKERDKDIRS